ncbi:MAG: PDDEXK nuclease domain-containing protein [Candidatus Aminicenantales bacterium]
MDKQAERKALLPVKAQVATDVSRGYGLLLTEISELLDQARRTAARTINSILTATYWGIGRRIVKYEQKGQERAPYGECLLARLSVDLKKKHGRGFSERNLEQMRSFYLDWEISQTPSAKLAARVKQPACGESAEFRRKYSGELDNPEFSLGLFPLSWSHYVHLMSVPNLQARAFYESESIAGGWSVRQLDRQIGTQFYERSLGSKNRDDFLARGRGPRREDMMTVEEEVRDPYLLEFLNLKDEYGESDLEEALIRHLEWFLLEMGTGFTFVARQKKVKVGDSWYRLDLLLYHRKLGCLVVVDLKRGKFSHADAGQMNLYLNYARENLKLPDESDPVGIILCGGKNEALVRYATGGIKAKVFASKYLTILPDEETLRQEILRTRRLLEARRKENS